MTEGGDLPRTGRIGTISEMAAPRIVAILNSDIVGEGPGGDKRSQAGVNVRRCVPGTGFTSLSAAIGAEEVVMMLDT